MTSELPLEGIRVIDLTMVWAGPFATKHLADLGAQVIKIEGPGRLDLVRSLTQPDPDADEAYNTSRYFNEYNRNKLGMAIDMQQPAGQQIVQRLAAVSDVLIENFRPGVLDRLGLDEETLRKINPGLVVVSLPGYSGVEPERGLPGYGPNVEQMGGLAWFNGYQGGPPQKSGISYGDPMAGLGGAAAVLMALYQRQRTGLGQRIEAGQRNLLIGLVGDALVAHQLGAPPERIGNRSAEFAPQGVYPSAGDDEWIAISADSDRAWTALGSAIGFPDDPDLATVDGRRRRHDDLDAAIAAWTGARGAREAADELQAAGVPASPVLSPAAVRDDPQLNARGFFRPVEHPQLGTMTLTAPGWHFEGLPEPMHRAPFLGEHNHEVLSKLLSYADDEIAELEEAGVIATRPRVRGAAA